jgi:eukaryotic-like serine/threonine-protein kinase
VGSSDAEVESTTLTPAERRSTVVLTSDGSQAWTRGEAETEISAGGYVGRFVVIEQVGQGGPAHPHVASVLEAIADLRLENLELDDAERLYARALAIGEQTGTNHPDIAGPLTGLGAVAIERGHPERAIVVLERALELRTREDVPASDRAEVQMQLARALWAQGSERDRSLALARAAVDAYREAGQSRAVALAEAEAWLSDPTRRGTHH